MFLLLIVALLGLTCAAANPMPKDNFHNHNHQHHSLATLQPQTTRIFNWTLSSLPSSSAPDGVSLPFLLGINGQPGYETPIECFEGDRIILTVFNNLTIPSSIHFHGLFQNGTNEADGAVGASQCAIPPGGTFVYNFTTDGQSGTYWWHSHFKSSYLDGLRGPLIVHEPQVTAARSSYSHSQDSTAGSASYDREVLVSLADHYHNSSDDLTDFYLNSTLNPDGNEPVFQSGLINGRGQFNCSATTLPCNPSAPITVFSNITPGSKTRVRIINMAAFSAFLFSIDGHSLTVIEVDGVAVQPHVVDAITLNVAQRYSVIVTADQPVANYWMRARMYFMAPCKGRETVGGDFSLDQISYLSPPPPLFLSRDFGTSTYGL